MTIQLDDQTSGAAEAALDALSGALDELAAVPGWRLDDAALTAAVAGLDRIVRLVQAQRVRLVGEAGARGLPGRSGMGGLTGWIRQVVPTTSPREAMALARRAEALYLAPVAAELGPTRDAALAGDLAPEQVDAVAATVAGLVAPAVPPGTVDPDTLAEAQGLLIEQARVLDAGQLHRLGGYLRARLDPGADNRLARDERAQQRARSLTVCPTGSGMVHLAGLLTPECGAAVVTAIDALSAPLPADADGRPDPRTSAQRRHDALQRLVETGLTGDSSTSPSRVPRTRRSAHRIITTVSHDTLTAALAHLDPTALQPATRPDGAPMSADALRLIACEADIVPVLLDPAGSPLDVGRTQYAFTARQRTAITVRDEHCTWGSCRAPATWCQIHHLTPFSAGGRTDLANAALLCGRHHRHVHRTGQTGRVQDGRVTWDDPPGPATAESVAEPTAQATGAITRATQALDHLTQRWLVRRRQ